MSEQRPIRDVLDAPTTYSSNDDVTTADIAGRGDPATRDGDGAGDRSTAPTSDTRSPDRAATDDGTSDSASSDARPDARADGDGARPVPDRDRSRPAADDGGGSPEALFPPDRAGELRSTWQSVQVTFVDEPRHAVEEADRLVATVIQQLAASFADERSGLERQWNSGGQVSTEDLRQALRRYRSFFDRLLSL